MTRKPTYEELEQRVKEWAKEAVERTRAEKALRESEARLQLILETVPSGFFTVDIDRKITYWNKQAERITGIKAEEAIGKDCLEAFDCEECKKGCSLFDDKTDKPIYEKECTIHVDGRDITISKNADILKDSRGHTIAYIESFVDISARKQAKEALTMERARLEYILRGTNVGTWEWNVQTGETIFNERWADILGYTLKEISPLSIDTWIKFCHPDDLKESNALLEKCFSGESEFYECEVRMKHKSGEWVWVLDRGKVASWTDNGKPEWMYGTHQNITERKRAEEERERLIGSLEAALANIKTLKGLLPICASCKSIRDDKGYWLQIEAYIRDHSEADFSHSVCPECAKKLYPELHQDNE